MDCHPSELATHHRPPLASPSMTPLEDDNILEEILLRLPTRPSSLPRAAAVCKKWCRLVSDPRFRRRFRAHHREPPLLGIFQRHMRRGGPAFHPILDPPDAIPPERFTPWDHDDNDGAANHDNWDLICSRRGLVLVFSHTRFEVIIWDPVTGHRRCVATPSGVDGKEMEVFDGTVLCTTDDLGHVHSVECHTSPFQVVLIYFSFGENEWYVCVYSSETGKWGDHLLLGIPLTGELLPPGVLSGDSLYWLSEDADTGIVKFDLVSQSIAVIGLPANLDTEIKHIDDLRILKHPEYFCVVRTNDGGVGLAVLTDFRLDIWDRKVSCNGAATWCLQKTVELEEITGLSSADRRDVTIYGYDEDGTVIFLRTSHVFFMVKFDSMQFTNLGQRSSIPHFSCHPYRNFLC